MCRVGFPVAQFPDVNSENLVKYNFQVALLALLLLLFSNFSASKLSERGRDSLSPHPLVSVIALIDLCPAGRE